MVCLTMAPWPIYLLTRLPEKAKTIIRKNKMTTVTRARGTNKGLIPKPPGRRSRDFNIFEEMKAGGRVEINKDTYNNLIVSRLIGLQLPKHPNFQQQNCIHDAVKASRFDLDVPFKDQEMAEVTRVFAYVSQTTRRAPMISKSVPLSRLRRSTLSLRSIRMLGQYVCSCFSS